MCPVIHNLDIYYFDDEDDGDDDDGDDDDLKDDDDCGDICLLLFVFRRIT